MTQRKILHIKTKAYLETPKILMKISKSSPVFTITTIENFTDILSDLNKKIEEHYGIKIPFGSFEPDNRDDELEILSIYRDIFRAVSPIRKTDRGEFLLESEGDITSCFSSINEKNTKSFSIKDSIEVLFLTDDENQMSFSENLKSKRDLVEVISDMLFEEYALNKEKTKNIA